VATDDIQRYQEYILSVDTTLATLSRHAMKKILAWILGIVNKKNFNSTAMNFEPIIEN